MFYMPFHNEQILIFIIFKKLIIIYLREAK
jgi:hypothetical protein